MKVVLCSPVSISYWGGAEKWLCEVGGLLRRNGHDVEIRALPYEYEGRKIDVSEVTGDIPYIESWSQRIEADLTYVYYQPMIWRFFNIKGPKIAGLHSAGLIRCINPFIYTTFRVLGGTDLSSFDRVHIVSPILKVRHRNIQLIPNWVDLERYRPVTSKEDTFTILFVGRQRKEKGWPTYLELCKTLHKNGYDFNYWSTGKGSPPVKGLSVLKEDIHQIYSRAHLTVCPSLVDTFGLVIVESLACGTPVVTTPIESHRLLDMPVKYASSLKEFMNTVLGIYSDWSKKNGEYDGLKKLGLDKVRKYDVKKIFPRLENMFIETAQDI